MDITLLDDIISKVPNSTACGHTQNFICASLANPDFDGINYFSRGWTKYYISDCTFEIITVMKNFLDIYKYIALDIDIDYVVELEHATVICQTDHGYKIIDSYIRTRLCSIHDFEFEHLQNLITTPSISMWNKLWCCNEQLNDSFDYSDVHLSYMYFDPMSEPKLFEDGILIQKI